MESMLPGDSRYNVREFRHLRRRLFQLQQEINSDSAALRLSSGSPNLADSARVDYYLNMRLKMEECAEIQYTLDYFERLAYQWPSRSQWLFGIVVFIAIVLAVTAVLQAL